MTLYEWLKQQNKDKVISTLAEISALIAQRLVKKEYGHDFMTLSKIY